MRATHPVDGWSAYYALLTEALSASPSMTPAPEARLPRPSLLDRLDNWFAAQRAKSRDRYLAQSTDLCQLEARILELERGSRYY